MQENNLKRAIQADLSSLCTTQRERAAILRKALEGKKVKKKIPAILALAAALALAATTALAYTLLSNQYFERVAQTQAKHGFYDEWTIHEKLSLLSWMRAFGVEMDEEEADALLAGGMSAREREERIDALIVAKYGVDGRADTVSLESVFDKEWGEISEWPMERKAWYSQMLIDSGLMGGDDDVFKLPADGAVSPERAMEVARHEILSVWGLTDADLAGYEAQWAYLTHASDRAQKLLHYEITFVPSDGKGSTYRCSVSDEGKVLSSADNPLASSPAEEKAWVEAEAHVDDPEVRAILMDYADAHGFSSISLQFWPLKNKMEVTNLMRPVIQAHMEADPQYANMQNIYIAAHCYGVPDDQAITQDQAVALAQEALAARLGVSAELASSATLRFAYYDITDPSAPLFKLTLYPVSLREDYASRGESIPEWLVCVNAYTGDIARAEPIDQGLDGGVTPEKLVELRN